MCTIVTPLPADLEPFKRYTTGISATVNQEEMINTGHILFE